MRWWRCLFLAGVALLASSATGAEAPQLHLLLTLAPDQAVDGEPIVASGRDGAADFIFLKRLDPQTAVLGYDSWGSPQVISRPFTCRTGETFRLDIEAPPIAAALAGQHSPARTFRAWWNGREIIMASVPMHATDRAHFFVGCNPLGGTTCAPSLNGQLAMADGSALPRTSTAWRFWVDRWEDAKTAVSWLLLHPRIVVVVALLVVLVLAVEPILRRRLDAPAGRLLRVTLISAAAMVFLFFIAGQSLTLLYPDSFGAYYDAAARSLLHGRLDVPRDVIPDEAFIFRGKVYGYFGPTPAVMRLALQAFTVVVGQWTRVLMTLDFAVCLLAGELILRAAVRQNKGLAGRPTRRSVILLLVNAGLGSTLLFLGSRAYVYHEAIICGAAWALLSVAATLRFLEGGRNGFWSVALLTGILAVQARPPAGLFALATLGVAGLAVASRRTRLIAAARGCACLLAFGTFNLVSYLKFHSFDGSPFRYHVEYSPERLARIGGRNFHLSNLPLNAEGYIYGWDLRVQPTFPFVFAEGPNQHRFRHAAIDIIEPIVPLPYCMTGMCFLAVLGSAAAWRTPWGRRAAAVLWLGVAPMGLALLTAVAMSHRYTADFCPFLIAASAVGLAALESSSGRWRTLAWLCTSWSVFISLALTSDFQGERVWGAPPGVPERFQAARTRIDEWVGVKP